jgi:hypothetical protein
MASNIDLIVLNGSTYAIWALDMETLLKSKELFQYTKVEIIDPRDTQTNFVLDRKKDEVVGVIMT